MKALTVWRTQSVRVPGDTRRVLVQRLAQETRKAEVTDAALKGHDGLSEITAGASTGLEERRIFALSSPAQFASHLDFNLSFS
jgi:hypothetical protein